MLVMVRKNYSHYLSHRCQRYLSGSAVVANVFAGLHRKEIVLAHRSLDAFFLRRTGFMLGAVEVSRLQVNGDSRD